MWTLTKLDHQGPLQCRELALFLQVSLGHRPLFLQIVRTPTPDCQEPSRMWPPPPSPRPSGPLTYRHFFHQTIRIIWVWTSCLGCQGPLCSVDRSASRSSLPPGAMALCSSSLGASPLHQCHYYSVDTLKCTLGQFLSLPNHITPL